MTHSSGFAGIAGISYFTPEGLLTNDMLAEEFPEWSVDKIGLKTGIRTRRITSANEFSSTLATQAAQSLFSDRAGSSTDFDYLILCTQTPDFFLPTTACLVHRELELPQHVGAIDVNQGCSGYVYSLGLAKGLIETGQANSVLVLTADTYSKLLNPADKSVRTIFGDAASATLVSRTDREDELMNGFTYGTDGAGAHHLMTTRGGLREGESLSKRAGASERSLAPSPYDLFMNGPEIFNFTLRVVPDLVDSVLDSAGLQFSDIDFFVPHQANAFMLKHLRDKLGISEERFAVDMEDFGNTVSSTIPMTLARLAKKGQLFEGMKIMVLGFGVGLSWAGAVLTWAVPARISGVGSTP